ncbi:protein kinase, ATP binding site-containing protein [Tanacetum coccineum]
MIRGILIFLNKWSPCVSLLKEELSRVPLWLKFHDVVLVAFISDGLSLIATKSVTLMMLDLYTKSMCLVSWGRSNYARILIEINACNDFSDNMIMDILNIDGSGYTKEIIRIDYEWVPPCCVTCLIYGHTLVDCSKATAKRVVNGMDKSKGQTSRAMMKDLLNNSFEALNVESLIIEEVATGNKATISGAQKEGKSSTPILERINVSGKQIKEGKLVLVDDDGITLEKVDYPNNLGSDDEVEPQEKIKNAELDKFEIVKVAAKEVKEAKHIISGGKDFVKHKAELIRIHTKKVKNNAKMKKILYDNEWDEMGPILRTKHNKVNREAISVKGSRGEYGNPREFLNPFVEIYMAMRMSKESSLPPHIDRGYRILIYEHAINGSLRDHLQDQDKLRCIPWEQRLKICLGAARGLKCQHSAKDSEFSLSIFVPKNKPQVSDNNWKLADTNTIDDFKASMDPIYKQSYIVNTEVDVYSFGLVMFEILSGVSLRTTDIYGEKPDLIRRVHRHYGYNEMDNLVHPNIRDQIGGRSLQTFAESAYKCLSYNIKKRPSMNRIIKRIKEALSKLATLGEALSLACIAEARFEDERSTIAIAKTNELTANVHVQDLQQTTRGRGDESNRIMLVTIHHMIYPITVEVLNQIFSPHGYVEKVVIFQKSAHVQALIHFQSCQNAIVMQENQEEHICYYYWENCFSILNTEEAGGDRPFEEFQEGDMVDALSSVLEQKSLKKGVDNGSERRDYALFGASLFAFLNPGPCSFAHRRIWDPGIKRVFLDNTLRTRICLCVVLGKSIVLGKCQINVYLVVGLSLKPCLLFARTRYSGANLSLLLLYIIKELAHAKSVDFQIPPSKHHPFFGYCDESSDMILVYEYADNGSLDYHLEDKDRRCCLTWVKRLKICLEAAKGLEYLHTGLGEDNIGIK